MSGENSARILVVGSDQDHRASITRMLNAEGFETFEAHDGKSAYNAIISSYEQTGGPGCSLVIVDTHQPSGDALVLLQELRAMGLHRLPLLVVSGGVSYEDVEMVAHQKPAGILIKPFDRDLLLQKMGQLLGGLIAT